MDQLTQILAQLDLVWSLKNKTKISAPIKLAKAIKYMGSCYERELEAIQIAIEYARDNLSPLNYSLHTFSDSIS